MFLHLFRKESFDQIRTFRFGAAMVTCTILVFLSTWILGDEYKESVTTYNRLSETARLSVQEAIIPSRVFPFIYMPPTPMSIFARGDTAHLGDTVQIRRWSVPDQARNSINDNELMFRLPTFDLLSIYTIILSLFGVLMTYDLITAERETGSLKMLCTFPVRRLHILAAKSLAALLALSLPFCISLVIALLELQFIHNISFTGEQWLSIFFMSGIMLGYCAVFVSLGTLASTLVRNSSLSLILVIFVWSVLTIFVPIGGTSLATALVDLPSTSAFVNQERQVMDEYNREVDGIVDDAGSLTLYSARGVTVEDPQLFDGNPNAYRLFINYYRFIEPRRQEMAEYFWNLQQHYFNMYLQQAETANLISSLSPSQHLKSAFTALSRTDVASHRDFIEFCRDYRKRMLDQFRDKGYFDSNLTQFFSRRDPEEALSEEKFNQRVNNYNRIQEQSQSDNEYLGIALFGPLQSNEIPPLQYRLPNIRYGPALQALEILYIIALILFVASSLAFLRYDIR